jgi:HEAT repeat protein
MKDERTKTKTPIMTMKRTTLSVISLLVVTGLALLTTRLVYGYDHDVRKLNRFVQSQRDNTPAMKMFREGRDFIEAENWQQAADRFRGYIVSFPRDRDMDAALYWYAYSLQKLNRKEEAASTLVRLQKSYPGSSWRREADAMLVVLGRADAVQQALKNDNCEIKILALQSLYQANEERALGYVTEVIKAPPSDCPSLKLAAVSILGSQGGSRALPLLLDIARTQGDLKLRITAIRGLSNQGNDSIATELGRLYDEDKTPEIRAQILRSFSHMNSPNAEAKLLQVARSGDDHGLRQLAIRYLGQRKSDESLNELIRIFDADRTFEIRAQVLRALSERDDPRARAKLLDVARTGETPELRIEAIRRLGDRGKSSLDDLLQLYSNESNLAIKMGLVRAYGDVNDPRALAKLYEIARNGTDPVELRLTAIRRLGERNDEQTVEQLVSLYDSEANVQVKAMLIRSFGDSSQKNAVRKLMTIARSDATVDLRKLAVRMLGESKDPEALKFLEDLLK